MAEMEPTVMNDKILCTIEVLDIVDGMVSVRLWQYKGPGEGDVSWYTMRVGDTVNVIVDSYDESAQKIVGLFDPTQGVRFA